MTVRAYCRSSQPPKGRRNVDNPLGVASQRAALLERFPDAMFYVDQAKSGRHGPSRRPALRQLLADLVAGDLVAVVRLDRLARDLRTALWLEVEIEERSQCRIVSLAGEGTATDGPADPVAVFTRRIAMVVAELQAGQAAAATAAALAVKRRAGLTTNGAAGFGYSLADGGRLIENPDEQRVVAEVMRFTRGRPSTATGSELAERLNAAGLLNRGGKPWNRVSAKRLAVRLAAKTPEAVK